jgi:hypothetical protein
MPSSTPSITWWTRIEPRPRSASVTAGLAAAVRDPLWLLARQRQLGATRGEDAGSAAYTSLTATVSPIAGWRPAGQAGGIPLNAGAPLEAAAVAEPVTPDLATRVELGQTFEALLDQALGGIPAALRAAFRQAYPFTPQPDAVRVRLLFSIPWDFSTDPIVTGGAPSAALQAVFTDHQLTLAGSATATERSAGAEWAVTDADTGTTYLAVRDGTDLELHLAAVPDLAAARFASVCAGEALDGVPLLADLSAGVTPPPLEDAAFSGFKSEIGQALDDLVTWAAEVYGELGAGDPAAWQADRQEYAIEVLATTPDAQIAVLASADGQAGDLDWHAFDLTAVQQAPEGIQPGPVEHVDVSVLPAPVRFRGMPNPRFWDFESAVTDFGDVRIDKRDLAKLVVMDFMLVHGNDWFLIPLQLPVGTVCTIEQLLVHDVFGGITLVERADGPRPASAPGSQRWTMFSTSDTRPAPAGDGQGAQVARFLVLPPTATATAQTGPIIEEVRFLHDEMANLVWAVERTITNGLGRPWPGSERAQTINAARTEGPVARTSPPPATPPGLNYRIQTPVPDNWVPLLPVTIDPVRGEVALEPGTIYGEWGQLVQPNGRLLANLVRLREEALPKHGIRVIRRAHRSRWTDGSTNLWYSRTQLPGEGEGASGLRFDLAVPPDQ